MWRGHQFPYKLTLVGLLGAFSLYTSLVYIQPGVNSPPPSPLASTGQMVWQEKNCQACHQLYGLGGYMGPDLTNLISNPQKGPVYAKGFIQNGTSRMPNLHLDSTEIESLIAFLTWVDKTGRGMAAPGDVNDFGSYSFPEK